MLQSQKQTLSNWEFTVICSDLSSSGLSLLWQPKKFPFKSVKSTFRLRLSGTWRLTEVSSLCSSLQMAPSSTNQQLSRTLPLRRKWEKAWSSGPTSKPQAMSQPTWKLARWDLRCWPSTSSSAHSGVLYCQDLMTRRRSMDSKLISQRWKNSSRKTLEVQSFCQEAPSQWWSMCIATQWLREWWCWRTVHGNMDLRLSVWKRHQPSVLMSIDSDLTPQWHLTWSLKTLTTNWLPNGTLWNKESSNNLLLNLSNENLSIKAT